MKIVPCSSYLPARVLNVIKMTSKDLANELVKYPMIIIRLPMTPSFLMPIFGRTKLPSRERLIEKKKCNEPTQAVKENI